MTTIEKVATFALCWNLYACGGNAPELAVDKVEDLGKIPLPSATAVGRDGGASGKLGDRILWTFGDTFLNKKNSIDGSNVLSATSAWASVGSPLAVTEPVDVDGIPAQLIPYTSAEIMQNRTDALNGWALWPGAMFDTGTAEGLVVFQRIKRTSGSGFANQGIGTARIAAAATQAKRNPTELFALPELLYFPNCIVDGNVLAVACETIGFLNIGCRLARAPLAGADNRSQYTFYDGSTWQADISKAAIVLDKVANMTVSFNPYLQRYLAVSGGVLSSTISLRTADHVEGPWSQPVEIQPDGQTVLPPVDSKAYNYIIIEHPELRSADGRSIVISYSRPTTTFAGDVRLARITFK
jgi:hypothetical protein